MLTTSVPALEFQSRTSVIFPINWANTREENTFTVQAVMSRERATFEARSELTVKGSGGITQFEVLSGIASLGRGFYPTVVLIIEYERGIRARIAEEYFIVHPDTNDMFVWRGLPVSQMLQTIGR